jgi:hypothetical protein
MPARGDRTAPQFDPKHPHQLRRYFADLDFLFRRSDTLDNQEQKRHACRYVDFTTLELWESLTEFSDHSQSFADFELAVFGLYPELAEECRWLVADLEKLVEERCRIGVRSIGDLGEYYRQFIPIATFLHQRNRLSDAEQSRMFVCGFQRDLWERIFDHLQRKFPDHFPGDPYHFGDIHQAAQFVLHVAAASCCNPPLDSRPPAMQPTISDLLEQLIAALRPPEPPLLPRSPLLDSRSHHARSPTLTCNFCGSSDHFIRKCPSAADYIRIGRCKRNWEGKITLPTGSFVARDVPGHFLRDRIDWWHSRNPGHLAADLLTCDATADLHPHYRSPTAAADTSVEDQIVALEYKLFALQKQNTSTNIAQWDRSEPLLHSHIPATHSNSKTCHPSSEPAAAPSLPKSDISELCPLSELLIQSFPSSPILGYAPPHQHNFGTVPKPRRSKKPTPVHYSDPPVYDEKIAPEVFDRAMHSDIVIAPSDLLSLSPHLYSVTSDVTT